MNEKTVTNAKIDKFCEMEVIPSVKKCNERADNRIVRPFQKCSFYHVALLTL